ncbi:MAG: histidine kinase dimerization/phospho-acceptor domain-containing protein, partial [Stellaceae bacterium]
MDEARRLKDFAEAAADWFWETDSELRFTRMTASSQLPDRAWSRQFLGLPAERAEAAETWRPLVETMRARVPFRDLRLVCRDGEATLYLSLSGVPVFGGEGFIGYRGIGRDLSLLKRAEDERLRAERELAETSALLRATIDNMDCGLLVLDAELRIRLWNYRMHRHFADPAPELGIGRPVADMIHAHTTDDPRRGEANLAFLRRVSDTRRAAVREMSIAASGRVIEMRAAPMPDGGLVVSYTDMSERKRVERELRRAKEDAELASRSKSEFLANMSHELRTPLNAIIGFADILKGEVFGDLGDPRYRDYATDIRDSGIHLLKLINDVLDVSKIEFGQIALNEEAVDIAGTVESCVRLMRDRAIAAELSLASSVPPVLPLLNCDELRVKQILLNLLSNAVKFTPAGGKVAIRAVLADRGFGLSVQD